MKRNWDRPAMRFASARYLYPQDMLDVTFENGEHFIVATESVLAVAADIALQHHGPRGVSPAAPAPPPDWAKIRVGETGDVLEVPGNGTVIEIPWDRIRSVADPQFRAHLADLAVERARRIGERIRAMRLGAGLTRAVLAQKVGVPRELVAGLEAGKIEPQTDLVERIAIVLGRRLRDFAQQ